MFNAKPTDDDIENCRVVAWLDGWWADLGGGGSGWWSQNPTGATRCTAKARVVLVAPHCVAGPVAGRTLIETRMHRNLPLRSVSASAIEPSLLAR